MSTTVAILSNFAISAPRTSPVYTAQAGVTDINVTMTIGCPTDTNAHMVLSIERSQDGGATWTAVNTTPADGGLQAKGPNAGQAESVYASTDVLYPQAGDQFRAVASPVSGNFTVSASIVTTP